MTDRSRRHLTNALQATSCAPTFSTGAISDHALESARRIRGAGRSPALVLHGMMPRSGTVYVGELLRLHPDFDAFPHQLWELPFLQLTGDMVDLQKSFLQGYSPNVGKLGEKDFLPLFGSALIAHLSSSTDDGRRLLLKVPSVQSLDSFFSVFPYENLLLLIRDGRDVVRSTCKTWPRSRFSSVCRHWQRSARMVLECHDRYGQKTRGYWLARFEDAVRNPRTFVREACSHFGLDESRYPFEEIDAIPVRGSSSLADQGPVSWDPVEKGEGFRPTGQWQEWSARKKRLFKRTAGQALIDLGYCDDLNW